MTVTPPLSSAGNWTPAFAGERKESQRMRMTATSAPPRSPAKAGAQGQKYRRRSFSPIAHPRLPKSGNRG